METEKKAVCLYKKPVFWAGIAALAGGAAVVVAVYLLAGFGDEDMADAVSQTYSVEDTGEDSAETESEGWSEQDESGERSGQREESASSDQENEEEIIDPAIWMASLDQAVTDAIRQAQLEPIVTDPEYIGGESHYILDIRDLNGRSVTDNVADEQDVTVYVLIQQVSYAKPDYEKMLFTPRIGGKRYVAAISFSREESEVFRVGSQEAESLWTMDEFRCELTSPYGERDEGRIQEMFPADLAEKEFKMSGSQRYIDMFTAEVLEQAVRDSGLDGDRLVADIFDIMFEVTHDEEIDKFGTGIYIGKRHPQYVSLRWYGDYTIRYICSALLRGEREEIEEKVLAADFFYDMVCWWDGFPPPSVDTGGREYFLEYLEVAQELADAHGMEWMRENEPYKWKILVMVSEIQQEMEQETEEEIAQG